MTLVRISIEQLVLLVMLGWFSLTRTAFAAENSPIARGEKPKQLNTTRAGEGPAWHAPSFDLYFTGGDGITRFDATGASHVFREPSGGANGLLFDHDGRLVVCEAANRRVTRTERDGSITVLAEFYPASRPAAALVRLEGEKDGAKVSGRMKFNSPNDLIIDSKGRIYFTDPRYGPRETMEMRDAGGKLVEGVYRIDAPGTVQRILEHEVDRPNGILVSPDDKHLFVADNNNNTVGGARKLWRFDLNPDGPVTAG